MSEEVVKKKATTKKQNRDEAIKKRKSTQKEKKTIPRLSEKSKKLTLVQQKQKEMLAIINSVEMITPEQQEQYLLAIAMGLVPDRFGLEVSVDTKLKAFNQLQAMQVQKTKQNNQRSVEDELEQATEFIFKVRTNNIYQEQQEGVVENDASTTDIVTDTENC